MLVEEAKHLETVLGSVKRLRIINLCSQSVPQMMMYQPHCYQYVIMPLEQRGNTIDNLDIKAGEGVNIIADVEDMQCIGSESYHIALFCNAIEHLWHPERAVAEIHRILKRGGVCWASAPSSGYPYHEDPIDTMLRMTTLEDWRRYFVPERWDIFHFKFIESYREQYRRVDHSTIIGAKKL